MIDFIIRLFYERFAIVRSANLTQLFLTISQKLTRKLGLLWWLFSVQNVSIGNWEWNKLMLVNSLVRGTNHNGMIFILKEHDLPQFSPPKEFGNFWKKFSWKNLIKQRPLFLLGQKMPCPVLDRVNPKFAAMLDRSQEEKNNCWTG